MLFGFTSSKLDIFGKKSESMLEFEFFLPDTGIFDITLEAYFGSCLSTKTKTINVTEFDPTAANNYNQLGIKSVNIYPNDFFSETGGRNVTKFHM